MGELSCLSHERKLYDVVSDLSHNYQISSMLDLGSGSRHFVEFLRQEGFNAEGVDGDESQTKLWNGLNYLHHGELTALENVFGERTFDLITARGIFCSASQGNYICEGDMDKIRILMTNPKLSRYLGDCIQENINQILVSAYNQLTPGGFLVVREDVTIADSIDFSKETAENIGYIVQQLDRQEAILQKPLNK